MPPSGSASRLCSQRYPSHGTASSIDPSSFAAWMSPSPERQLPRRDPLQLQLRPAARIQQQVPIPDKTDAAADTAEPPPPWGLTSESHLGSHHRRGCAASKHRPLSGGRPEHMEASFPAQAPLASPAAGHHLPALGSIPARAPPAGRSAVCGRGSCSDPFLMQESSAWRLAACHRHQQTAGVLSDWLRGRDPKLTREDFRERWCHLCVLRAEPNAQLTIHWSAQHPVPLPA
ncbi:g5780 [Coccomyxa elongata]